MLPRIPDLHFNFILLQSDKTMGNRFFLSYSKQAVFCWYILFRNFPTLCTINPTLQQSESVWWGNQITNHPCLRPPCTHQAKVPIPFIYRDIVVEVVANKVKLYTTCTYDKVEFLDIDWHHQQDLPYLISDLYTSFQ